jgi:hypothetical protein
MSMKRYTIIPLAVFGLALGACSELAQDPASPSYKRETAVVICPNDDPSGANPLAWTKIDMGSGGVNGATLGAGYNFGWFTFSGKTVVYEVNAGFELILCIKSGSQVGTISPIVLTGSGTYGPIDQDISHLSWKITLGTTPDGEWCSPGFWRQAHHQQYWPTLTSQYYNDYALLTDITGALAGNPTLLDVLQSPQVYGGSVTNLVADLLSDLHPLVDYEFGDERPEPHVCTAKVVAAD